MARFDVRLTDSGDVDVINGDISLGESDQQHIEDTIRAFPGTWKQFPTDGVGIGAYSYSPAEVQEIQKIIRQQLTLDGYRVGNPKVSLDVKGELVINPDATI